MREVEAELRARAESAGPDVVYLANIQSPGAADDLYHRRPQPCPLHRPRQCAAGLRLAGSRLRPPLRPGEQPLPRRTELTLVRSDELATELSLTESRGYALDREEREVGINCLALPLFLDPTTDPSGATGVTARARRMQVAGLDEAVPEIRSDASSPASSGAS